MKTAILILVGVAAGMIFYRIPHYLDQWSVHGLPPQPYVGPKFRYWKNGVEQ